MKNDVIHFRSWKWITSFFIFHVSFFVTGCTAPDGGDPWEAVPQDVAWAYRYDARNTGGIMERRLITSGLRPYIDSTDIGGYSGWQATPITLCMARDEERVKAFLRPYELADSGQPPLKIYQMPDGSRVLRMGRRLWVGADTLNAFYTSIDWRDAHIGKSVYDIPGFRQATDTLQGAWLMVGGRHHPSLPEHVYYLGSGDTAHMHGHLRTYRNWPVMPYGDLPYALSAFVP